MRYHPKKYHSWIYKTKCNMTISVDGNESETTMTLELRGPVDDIVKALNILSDNWDDKTQHQATKKKSKRGR